MSVERNVLEFPVAGLNEETASRVMAEARRLAGLAPGEWKIWIVGSAERLGIAPDILESVVIATLKDLEKKVPEEKK